MTMTSAHRPLLYSATEIGGLLSPRAVAVVGASERPGAFGGQVLLNLQNAEGVTVYPVNPRVESVYGVAAYPSLSALADRGIDLAAICVPQSAVVDVAREALENGITNVIIYASGFAEGITPEGHAAQQELAALAEKGLRILGPNCLGFINFHRGIEMQFIAGYAEQMVPGGIGIVAQSGALGYLLTQAQYRGVGFSYWAAPGNSSDVDALDLAGFMLDDPNTRAVVVVFEGTSNGERIFALGRRAAATGKAVIVHKLGQSEIGASSARSHTGVLAGSNAVFSDSFRQAGLVVVDHFDEIVETAAFHAKVPRAESSGIAVLSASGGACIIAADEAEAAGIPLPPLQPKTVSSLLEVLPGFGTVGNPTDATAEATRDPEIFRSSLRILGDDPGFAIVLIGLTVASEVLTGVRARIVTEFAATRDGETPLAVVWLSEWSEGPGSQTFAEDSRVPIFRSFRAAMSAIRGWLDWSFFDHASIDSGYNYAADDMAERAAEFGRACMLENLGSIDQETETLLLTEVESKSMMALLGLATSEPVVLAAGDPNLDSAIGELAFPVVAKVVSRTIAHKARVGGVKLGLETAEDVRAAVKEFAARFEDGGAPSPTLVERMVAGEREWFVGGKRDHAFGVVLTIGLGGTDVEGGRPVLVVGQPSPDGIRALLAAAAGEVGEALQDTDAVREELVTTAVRVLRLFRAFPEVEELDINPLLETEDGLVSVDAAVIVKPDVRRER